MAGSVPGIGTSGASARAPEQGSRSGRDRTDCRLARVNSGGTAAVTPCCGRPVSHCAGSCPAIRAWAASFGKGRWGKHGFPPAFLAHAVPPAMRHTHKAMPAVARAPGWSDAARVSSPPASRWLAVDRRSTQGRNSLGRLAHPRCLPTKQQTMAEAAASSSASAAGGGAAAASSCEPLHRRLVGSSVHPGFLSSRGHFSRPRRSKPGGRTSTPSAT